MRQLVVGWGVAALVAALVAVPAAAAPVPSEQLTRAEDDLAAVTRRLERAQDSYAAAHERLAAVHSRLGRVQRGLAAARDAEDNARRGHERALARVAAADAALAERTAALSERVSTIYKRGMPHLASLFALDHARGPHDVAIAAVAAKRILENDRDLVESTRRQADEARQALASARAAARAAAARRSDVEELVDHHRRLVAEAETQRAAIRRVVKELSRDQRALRGMVDALRRLLTSVEAVLRDPVMVPFDQPAPAWASALPAAGRRWAGAVDAAAARAGLDGRLFAALVWSESSFRADAVSSAGAIGLAQLMPATARSLGVDPYDPHDNLLGGARYLHSQLVRFWDLELGIAAYNAGPSRVAKAGSIDSLVETRLYVLTVLSRWRRLR